ncbi:MAG: hypothetical protein Q9173_003537 [Seirophora scorigena]
MDKAKSSTRHQAWYSDSGSDADYNNNPFAKRRKPSIYPEPEDDEGHKPPDTENFVAGLVRRGTRKLTLSRAESIVTSKPAFRYGRPPSQLQPVDEEKPAASYEDQHSDEPTFRSITWKQRAFLLRRQWKSQLARFGLSSQWEVRPAIADIATTTIAFAPLSASGQFFLPANPRPQQTTVIEYNDNRTGSAKDGSAGVVAPRFKVFSSQKGQKHFCGDTFKGLDALTSEVEPQPNSSKLRVFYVQDDNRASDQLISDFHIQSPAFSRSRTSFRDWIHGEEEDHLSVWQTALWRPSYDRSRDMVRAAFGLQYLIPQLQNVSVLESHSRFSKKSKMKAVVQNANDDVHDNSLQRLSVYIQLPRDPTTPVSSTESSSEVYQSAIRSLADRGKKQAGSATLACEKTVVILDSRLKAIATAPLIAGEEPWQQLLEYLEPSCQSECLALAVVGLAFEAVAARWVHYILCMHNYIASVEERVYEDPADDSRTGALWSVSKQLLQAERLLKFHILLLENIQNDFGGLSQAETSTADWLRPNLDEFRRLSSEVEETLKKPTAHMVDLVSAGYHSD